MGTPSVLMVPAPRTAAGVFSEWLHRLVDRLVDFGGRRPFVVLGSALVLMIDRAAWRENVAPGSPRSRLITAYE